MTTESTDPMAGKNPSPADHPSRLTAQQRQSAIDRTVLDRDRVLAAIAASQQAMELRDAALLAESLGQLHEALRQQWEHSQEEESLLRDIELSQPQFATRVEKIRDAYYRLAERTVDLQRRLADPPADLEPLLAEVRDLLYRVRDTRGQEHQVVFDAYELEIGVGD